MRSSITTGLVLATVLSIGPSSVFGQPDESAATELPAPLAMESMPLETSSTEMVTGPGSTSTMISVQVDEGSVVQINDKVFLPPVGPEGFQQFLLTEFKSGQQKRLILISVSPNGSHLAGFEVTVNAGQDIVIDLRASGPYAIGVPAAEPMDQREIDPLQEQLNGLRNSVTSLNELADGVQGWKTPIDDSVAALQTAKGELDTARGNLKTQLEQSKTAMDLSKAALDASKTTLDQSATDLESKLSDSASKLGTAKDELVKSAKTSADGMAQLVTQLKEKIEELSQLGTSGDSVPRVYQLESPQVVQATLTYNGALELNGISFVDSTLEDNFTFTDATPWNADEMAVGGKLTLKLVADVVDGTQKPLPAQTIYQEDVTFNSKDDRSANVRFAKTAALNIKTWIENAATNNPGTVGKLTQGDGVRSISITGEFKLGFAESVALQVPLKIMILGRD